MTRIILIVVALGLLLAGGGFLILGAFPPEPKTQTIEKTLPNDQFRSH